MLIGISSSDPRMINDDIGGSTQMAVYLYATGEKADASTTNRSAVALLGSIRNMMKIKKAIINEIACHRLPSSIGLPFDSLSRLFWNEDQASSITYTDI